MERPEDAFEQYLTWFIGPSPDAEEDSTAEEKEDYCTNMMSTPALTLSSSPGIPSSSSPSAFHPRYPGRPPRSTYTPPPLSRYPTTTPIRNTSIRLHRPKPRWPGCGLSACRKRWRRRRRVAFYKRLNASVVDSQRSIPSLPRTTDDMAYSIDDTTDDT